MGDFRRNSIGIFALWNKRQAISLGDCMPTTTERRRADLLQYVNEMRSLYLALGVTPETTEKAVTASQQSTPALKPIKQSKAAEPGRRLRAPG
jgi:hypothetical protein